MKIVVFNVSALSLFFTVTTFSQFYFSLGGGTSFDFNGFLTGRNGTSLREQVDSTLYVVEDIAGAYTSLGKGATLSAIAGYKFSQVVAIEIEVHRNFGGVSHSDFDIRRHYQDPAFTGYTLNDKLSLNYSSTVIITALCFNVEVETIRPFFRGGLVLAFPELVEHASNSGTLNGVPQASTETRGEYSGPPATGFISCVGVEIPLVHNVSFWGQFGAFYYSWQPSELRSVKNDGSVTTYSLVQSYRTGDIQGAVQTAPKIPFSNVGISAGLRLALGSE